MFLPYYFLSFFRFVSLLRFFFFILLLLLSLVPTLLLFDVIVHIIYVLWFATVIHIEVIQEASDAL